LPWPGQTLAAAARPEDRGGEDEGPPALGGRPGQGWPPATPTVRERGRKEGERGRSEREERGNRSPLRPVAAGGGPGRRRGQQREREERE